MYQIIYIDIDEEITSVIDKLRKVKTTEVFLAIPKRSLILQSIMSLKLLCREAEKSGKHMIVVTQDPQEQKTVEKAGIETRNTLEGLDTEGEMRESVTPKIQEESVKIEKAAARKVSKRKSMDEIGSNDFYEAKKEVVSLEKKNPFSGEFDKKEVPKKTMSEISRDESGEMKNKSYFQNPDYNVSFLRPDLARANNFKPQDNQQKEKMLRTFFEEQTGALGSPMKMGKEKIASQKRIPISGKIKKAIFILFISGIIAAAGALFYLFVPHAEVRVKLKSQAVEKDLDVKGRADLGEVDALARAIPAKLLEKEETYEFSYPVSGKSASSGKKAKGTVVIYNEFSSASQSLVATTRLETADKKIFRLTKGVTVPGTSEVGGKVVPGAIEAEVIADAGGEEYNIDPATFTIPGFSGSPKFEKFSAKSSAKMIGGSASSEGSGVASLTQADVAIAKEKSEAQAKNKILEDLKKEVKEGDRFFESASETTILESSSLSKVGESVGEFKYQVKIKISAMVFYEAYLKNIFLNAFNVADSEENESRLALDYGAVSADLGNKTMTIKARGKFSSSAGLDSEKLKGDLAGKSGLEIEGIIKNYPQISEIEIDVTPTFLFKKVPQVESRIEIVVK